MIILIKKLIIATFFLFLIPSAFALDIPVAATLTSPSGNINDNTPSYIWNAVSNSTWYYLWVDDSSGNIIKKWYTASEVGCNSGTGSCSITPSITLQDGAGQWWIQTWNSAGYGPWSVKMSFNLASATVPDAATLVSPTGNINDSTTTYTWSAVSNATWYYLWVNDSSGNKIKKWYTASAVGCSSGTGSCSISPAITLQDGAGQWWIQTWNDNGYGAWSTAMSFNLSTIPDAPTLVSPTGKTSVNTPAYTWNAVANATHYYLEVTDSSGNQIIQRWYTASEVGCNSGMGTCSISLATTLQDGNGHWKVFTYNGNIDTYGLWSTSLTFTIDLSSSCNISSTFNTDAAGWTVNSGTWNVNANGEYVAAGHSYSASIFEPSAGCGNIDIEVKQKRQANVDNLDSLNGLIIRSSTIGYYFFGWNRQGEFKVTRNVFNNYSTLQDWTVSSAINTDDWNTLRVKANGYSLSYYINNTLVWSSDTDGSPIVVSGKVQLIKGAVSTTDPDDLLVDYVKASPAIEDWHKWLGSNNYDHINATAIDDSGNIYLAGDTRGSLFGENNQGGKDAFLVKYDSSGTKLWHKWLGSSGTDNADALATDSSGNVYLVGYTSGSLFGETNAGGDDAFLVKYSSSGAKLWHKWLGSVDDDYADALATDSSDNIYLAGTTGKNDTSVNGSLFGEINYGGYDAFLVKYDSSGTKLWHEWLDSGNFDFSKALAVDNSDNVYLSGITWGSLFGETSQGAYDIFLVKYDSSGTKLWHKWLGSSSFEDVDALATDSNGNIYLAGDTEGSLFGETNQGDSDAFLVKYNSSGTKLWHKWLGSSSSDHTAALATDSSGNVYLAGYTWYYSFFGETNLGKKDTYIVKYNSNGNKLWHKWLGTFENDFATTLAIDSSSNVYLAGGTSGSLFGETNQGSTDGFLVKYSQ